MSPTQTIRAVGAALKGPLGLVGWTIVLLRPILHLLDRLEEMDFINTYWPVVRTFLDTGAGTLVSVAIGASIIGYSIVHAIHTASSPSDRQASSILTSQPDNNARIIPNIAPQPSAGAEAKISVVAMSEYDRERRKREIDELVASITAGKTLQSLKDAGALAYLLQSAIFTLGSVAAFRNELIKVRNSLVIAGNERLEIANRYPEQRDILILIGRRDQIADTDPDPHDLRIWPLVHSYLDNPNIPDEVFRNVAAWTFFRDTKVIAELNAQLFGYCDWCDELTTALVEKRDALG